MRSSFRPDVSDCRRIVTPDGRVKAGPVGRIAGFTMKLPTKRGAREGSTGACSTSGSRVASNRQYSTMAGTPEVVVPFLDDREGLKIVPGQVDEVQIPLVEKTILEGPFAHPFEEIAPHIAHKYQGLVDLLYLGELPGVEELENGPDTTGRHYEGIREFHEAVEPFRKAIELLLDIEMGGITLLLW
jgi:hypothetical protein